MFCSSCNCHSKIVYMRIAIVRLSALGDIVQSMIMLQFINKNYPYSKVDWVIEERFKGILENNPHIRKIHTINLNKAKKRKSVNILFSELNKVRGFGDYDLVIDTQGLVKSAIVAKLLGGKKIIGFDKDSIREQLASYLYNQKTSIKYSENTILRSIALISESLNINVTNNEIINKQSYLVSKSSFETPLEPFIIFIIGSTWESRNYPKEKFVEVAKALKISCLVVWGNENEKEKAEWMRGESENIQVLPSLSLDDLKLVINKASLLIGNDTGPTHMAWGLNTPSITLFGPTPISRLYITPNHRALKSSSMVDHSNLNKSDFSISEITIKDIIKISKELLGTSS